MIKQINACNLFAVLLLYKLSLFLFQLSSAITPRLFIIVSSTQTIFFLLSFGLFPNQMTKEKIRSVLTRLYSSLKVETLAVHPSVTIYSASHHHFIMQL